MSSRLRALGFAVGLFFFAVGVGTIVDGSLQQGLVFLAMGVALGGIPAARYLAVARHAPGNRADRRVYDVDPALREPFRRASRLVTASSAVPFLAAVAVFAGAFRAAPDGATSGAVVGIGLLSAFFAAIPAFAGVQLIRAGRLLAGGDERGAQSAIRLHRIILVLAALVAAGAANNRGANWMLIAGAAVADVVWCLIANGQLQRFLRSVAAGPLTAAAAARQAEAAEVEARLAELLDPPLNRPQGDHAGG